MTNSWQNSGKLQYEQYHCHHLKGFEIKNKKYFKEPEKYHCVFIYVILFTFFKK